MKVVKGSSESLRQLTEFLHTVVKQRDQHFLAVDHTQIVHVVRGGVVTVTHDVVGMQYRDSKRHIDTRIFSLHG